jgi:hypothetical protein
VSGWWWWCQWQWQWQQSGRAPQPVAGGSARTGYSYRRYDTDTIRTMQQLPLLHFASKCASKMLYY